MQDYTNEPDGFTAEIIKAYHANDSQNISEYEREERLKQIFADNGDEIEFIN
jgi:hypothetical protein